MEESRKDNSRLKKRNKELERQLGELQRKIDCNDQLELKMGHIEHNYATILGEFNRYKEASERRTGIHEKLVAHLREKFTYQLTTVLGEEGKEKTKRGRFDLV